MCGFTSERLLLCLLLFWGSLQIIPNSFLSIFAGTKIIFWDLREPFIENLYKPSVSQSRLESVMDPLDMVLRLIFETILYISNIL